MQPRSVIIQAKPSRNVKTAGADASHEFLYHLEAFAGGTSKVPNDMPWLRLIKDYIRLLRRVGGGFNSFLNFRPIYIYTWVGMVSNLTCAYVFGKNHQPTNGSNRPGNGGTVACLGVCEQSAMVALFAGVRRFISILGHMKTFKHLQSIQIWS